MRTEHLKFALLPEQTIRLPKGCRITGVTVTDDITSLVIESPYGAALSEVRAFGEKLFWVSGEHIQTEDHHLRVYMEGEVLHSTDAEGKEVKTVVQIPEESDTLREIAVFDTVECAATWHLFTEVKA